MPRHFALPALHERQLAQIAQDASKKKLQRNLVISVVLGVVVVGGGGAFAYNKQQQAEREKAAMGGVAPTKLLTAQLLDFGNTVVMRSKHQPDKGDLLQITRVWVKRDGRWQETLSYQTGIKTPSK